MSSNSADAGSSRRSGSRAARRAAIGLAAVSVVSMVGVATAVAAGPPEVDKANATIKVSPVKTFTAKSCLGEDATKYVTYRGTWNGAENDSTPGSTDYNLSGQFVVKSVVWTINLATGRGILTGTAVVDSVPPNGTSALETYAGPLTLVTQGLPDQTGQAVPARGYIDAPTYSPNGTFTSSAADGGRLVANVEFEILPGFAAVGQFGDANASLGFADYSVTTANQAC